MKTQMPPILITAVLTWLLFSVIHAACAQVELKWLISAVKAPGKMAIADIQSDMNEGRHDLAKAKLQAFMDTWHRFDTGTDSFRGAGIGDIMVTFSEIENEHDR